jgi:hypothetical protein
MKAYELVIKMAESFVIQLEGLKFTKQEKLAIKLVGEIDACITIAEVTSDPWNTRVAHAMVAVMADPPQIKPVAGAMDAKDLYKIGTSGAAPSVAPAGVPQLLPTVASDTPTVAAEK